jgi:hypothetical protein
VIVVIVLTAIVAVRDWIAVTVAIVAIAAIAVIAVK